MPSRFAECKRDEAGGSTMNESGVVVRCRQVHAEGRAPLWQAHAPFLFCNAAFAGRGFT